MLFSSDAHHVSPLIEKFILGNTPQRNKLWRLTKDGDGMSNDSPDNIERELKTQEAADLLEFSNNPTLPQPR